VGGNTNDEHPPLATAQALSSHDLPNLIDEAICLRTWDWSETSQTAALFTRERGVVRVLAKGSRRAKAPYSGGVEILTRAEIGLILRPNSELALLTSWDLHQTFPALRNVLAVYNTGLYMADLIFHFVRDHDAHTRLYEALLVALSRMKGAIDAPQALLGFQWTLLNETGFKPEFAADVRTGVAIEDESEYHFSASLGGIFCRDDASDETVSRFWRVRPETIRLLRSLAYPPASESEGSLPELDTSMQTVDRANRLLASYARHVLGSQLTTMAVLFGDRLAQ